MTTVGNLRRGARLCALTWIAPSTLLVLALTGVAARPTLSLAEARAERTRVAGLVQHSEAESAHFAGFHASGGPERVRVALERVRALLPAPLPELELHGLLRLLATSHGLRLDTLQVSEPADAGFERLSDVVARRRVRLEGSGDPADLLTLLRTVRALGRPIAVHEFSLEEHEARGRRWELVLDLFESRAPSEFPAPDSSDDPLRAREVPERGQP